MADFDAKSHGLAGSIRASVESEQYDLGGYTELRAKELIATAFSSPLEMPTKMIKFTFIVGGGKLVRSRYADDLPKWVNSALRDVGFSEDRSAAETFDSQGTYKQQHDTGQNLKYIIVYPFVQCSSQKAPDCAGNVEGLTPAETNTSSPEYITVACELSTLKDIVATKCPSYKQKKRLLQHLQKADEEFKQIEAKLVSGAPLDSREQFTYDSNSGNDEEKIAWLQSEIKHMVEKGFLTAFEKEEVLDHVKSNESAAAAELESAKAENKPKKAEKLLAKLEAISARKNLIDSHKPHVHRFACAEQLHKLYLRLFPLRALEDKGRSMSLTLADLKTLEEKSDIEAAILTLQSSARGWFEDESEFEVKCAYEEGVALAAFKTRKGGPVKKASGGGVHGGAGASAAGRSAGGWATATAKKGAVKSMTGSGGAKKLAGQSSYAAAFSNSDSD